jgi:hypothetical protein
MADKNTKEEVIDEKETTVVDKFNALTPEQQKMLEKDIDKVSKKEAKKADKKEVDVKATVRNVAIGVGGFFTALVGGACAYHAGKKAGRNEANNTAEPYSTISSDES